MVTKGNWVDRDPTWLLQYSRDVYSQGGEDGIIEKVLEILPDRDRWCVEFGAWDGTYLTNTRNLIETQDYRAVLIEADPRRFESLERNYSDREDVITLNEYVGISHHNSLDYLLSRTPIPAAFDLLSIDVDGNDYHVWKSVTSYRPKVVVIEYNPTIPTHIGFVQPADPTVNQGSSLSSIVDLGNAKGYELVSVTRLNAIFVRREYYSLFHIASNAPEVLRTDLGAITYIFSGYDGRVFLRGNMLLPWHAIRLRESKFQQVPYLLREFPGNYTFLHKWALWMYRLVVDPRNTINALVQRMRRGTSK